MPKRFKINALIILVLAVVFYFFFMAAKHDGALSAVNAFANDPYDAVGSFGVQAAVALGLLSFFRAFRPFCNNAASEEQKVFLARTQMLAALATAITLASNIVAMARYPNLWTGSQAGYKLAGLLGGLLVFAIFAGWLAHRSVQGIRLHAKARLWLMAALVSLAAILMLAFYPESLRKSMPGELFTVLVGATLLFAAMWALGMALMPYQTDAKQLGVKTLSGWLNEYKYQVIFVILLGVLMGFLLVLGESTEGGTGPNLKGLARVALVYIGLETSALLIGYGFLKKPVGFFRRN